mgnify:FL=1
MKLNVDKKLTLLIVLWVLDKLIILSMLLLVSCNDPIAYECGITEPRSTYNEECDCEGIIDTVLVNTYQCSLNDSVWLVIR